MRYRRHLGIEGLRLARHGLDVSGPEQWNGGQIWTFKVCPWNPDHKDTAAFVAQLENGALSAGCHHDGCTGKDWFSLKALFEVADETDHADDGVATQGTPAMPSGGAFRRCPRCGERPAPPDALCFRCQPEGEE